MAAVSVPAWAARGSSAVRRVRRTSSSRPSSAAAANTATTASTTAAAPPASATRSLFKHRRDASAPSASPDMPARCASTTTATAATAAAAPTTTASTTSSSSSGSAPATAQASKSKRSYDPYYGFRDISLLCERFVNILFSCPNTSRDGSAPRVGAANKPAPHLAQFVAYALYRTRLPEEVTYQTLYLLKRLKQHFPAARGSTGHPLFISAMMLASKSICDDTYSNKSWSIVGQGLFSLAEINHMERELFGFLNYNVNVDEDELAAFTKSLNDPAVNLEHYLYLACVAPRSPRSSSSTVERTMESTSTPCSDASSAPPRSRSSWRLSAPITGTGTFPSPHQQTGRYSQSAGGSPPRVHAPEPARANSAPGCAPGLKDSHPPRSDRALSIGMPTAPPSTRTSRVSTHRASISPARPAYGMGYTPRSTPSGSGYHSAFPPSASRSSTGPIMGEVPRLSYSSASSASAHTSQSMDMLSPNVLHPTPSLSLTAHAYLPHGQTLTKSPQQASPISAAAKWL